MANDDHVVFSASIYSFDTLFDTTNFSFESHLDPFSLIFVLPMNNCLQIFVRHFVFPLL